MTAEGTHPAGIMRWQLPLVLVLLAVVTAGGSLVAGRSNAGEDPADVAVGASTTTTLAAPASTSEAGPTTAAPTTTPPTTAPADLLPPSEQRRLSSLERIAGDITPKSIVHSGDGRFVAQNMMYRHTITLYDRSFQLVATIPDTVRLADFGIAGYEGEHQGSPVEAAFTSDGAYAYASNYQMYGAGFGNPGHDECGDGAWDNSFVYRVDVAAARIDQVIEVGAVPKYVAVTPDDKTVLVTNWCTYDMSVIDAATGREVRRLDVGRFPRGIVVSPDSRTAYIAVMGSTDIAVVNLTDWSVSWFRGVGGSPRHVVLSPDGQFLYATLNGDGTVVKLDARTGTVLGRVATGDAPRSMAIADDGGALYVVNYFSNSVSKVRTADMTELQEIAVGYHPIGITYDAFTANVWVANYGGTIDVLADR